MKHEKRQINFDDVKETFKKVTIRKHVRSEIYMIIIKIRQWRKQIHKYIGKQITK